MSSLICAPSADAARNSVTANANSMSPNKESLEVRKGVYKWVHKWVYQEVYINLYLGNTYNFTTCPG